MTFRQVFTMGINKTSFLNSVCPIQLQKGLFAAQKVVQWIKYWILKHEVPSLIPSFVCARVMLQFFLSFTLINV